ncbi:chaperone binding protein, putative [Pediculus humanus corporis]|uniref:Chaperone binding protein, putative n=1 Tax=Pediculus humanus subsp. corporis TaxID=121224 RepID=E0VPW6_PEDHC|nr:chaperone binding protein, putative [Pediculus humanus corporis]EEB15422.1 chaperone binding protein, putative [Pediculus humanus corporis]
MTEINQEVSEVKKARHDWYQNESQIVLSILSKNINEKDFFINFTPETLNVSFNNENGIKHNLNFNLLYEINPSECLYKISPSKVEIKLKKKEGFWWKTLEKDLTTCTETNKQTMSKVYPSSSVKPKDWDKIVGDIYKEDDKLEADDALNAIFQKIYAEGNVKKEKVTMKPPDGMEWKKWN